MKVRTLVGLLVVITAGIFFVAYAPTNLGGRTTYVSTYGTSMLPRFHGGDLAVVQPAGSYHVGEIVAYHSSVLRGAVVLHRIVAINDGHFTFKGDNNHFLDPVQPTATQIVGRLRFRIPRGGAIRSFFARPLLLFPLLALALTGAGGFWTRKKRRRAAAYGAGSRRTPNAAPATRRRRLGVVVPVAAALTAAGFLIAAIAVWTMPRAEASTRRAFYTQNLALGYTAVAHKGAAYPKGTLTTGDPIFTRLVNTVDVQLDYTLRTNEPARAVRGTYEVVANVASPTGWSGAIPLTPTRTFSGDHLHATAPLSLDQIRELEARFSAETGLQTTQATISIAPRVRVQGAIAGAKFSDAVSTKLEFQLTAIEMTPISAVHPGASIARNGSVTIPAMAPAALGLWKLHLSADAARIVLLIALALALAAAAAVLATDRRRVALGELDAINRRYGRLLIAVDSVPPAGERTSVRVESMHALARLSHVHEQPIVHASGYGGHRFALATEAVVYYYDADSGPLGVVASPAAA